MQNGGLHPFFLYLGGESNPYLKFRKLLFYPLNYKAAFVKRHKGSLFYLFCQ